MQAKAQGHANKIEMFYKAFRDISQIVHSSIDLDEVLEIVVWKTAEVLNAKGAVLRILNLETGELELNSAYGLSEKYLTKGPITEKKLITDLYRESHIIIIDDVLHDPRIQYPKEAAKEGIRTLIDAPLKFKNEFAGILRIFFTTARSFSDEEIQFLESMAQQCACAIEKVRYIAAQQSRFDQLALHTEKLSALGRMAAGIAHEINNPLAGILLYASNMYKKVQAGNRFHEGLGVIIRETQRCKLIIQDLLEFSREKEPNKVMADMNQIVEKSLRILENEFRLRHLAIIKKLRSDVNHILLDEDQIEQVFVNLLLNAAQAIDDQGTIRIEIAKDLARNKIIVRISDTGPGIPLEHMDKIFDPFFSTRKDGSGLGLAVSYGIIRNHKGSINVENLKDGGCQFTITLPILEE